MLLTSRMRWHVIYTNLPSFPCTRESLDQTENSLWGLLKAGVSPVFIISHNEILFRPSLDHGRSLPQQGPRHRRQGTVKAALYVIAFMLTCAILMTSYIDKG